MAAKIYKSATIHPTAKVSEESSVGEGVKIWDLAQVREKVQIGSGTIVGRNVYIDFGVEVGRNCKIQNNALVYHPAKIEDGVFIGPAAVFTNDRYPRAINADGSIKAADDWDPAGVTALKGASIGAQAVVLGGVTIGSFALVAMGAVVVADVPDHAIVVGVPARFIGYACHCARRLKQRGKKWYCEFDKKYVPIKEQK